ncbi:MAG: hypothetical protein FVQ82_17710 [Planctomycetes bacterium]|nr:hypothetical protein [Planctomycetota bacterium]
MAKYWGGWWSGRPPAFRGRYIFDTARGVGRMRAWPRKRGPPTNPITQQWNLWFKVANYLAKYASSYDISRAKELTEGTKLYPRDIILSAMRGRLFWFTDEDGNKWYPYMALIDISESIDVLAKAVGDVLVRGQKFWGAPPPGNEGDRLTYHPGSTPDWQPAGGGGAGGFAGCLVHRSSVYSVPRMTWTTLPWQVEHYDTDGFFTNPPSATRMTIPSGFDWCRLTVNIGWAGSGIGYRHVILWRNGAVFPGGGIITLIPTSWGCQMNLSSAVTPCVAGDYFEVRVFHNGPANLNVEASSEGTFFNLQAFAAP